MNTVNSYEEVPYVSNVFKDTQPGELATIATLLGLQPPSLEGCRVLELGCASGTNLMAMAQAIPDGEFVGVDLAVRQIQDGQEKLRCLKMNNVSLKQMSIMDITHKWGKFDYIVAHGVYSWVPAKVQDKILRVCHDNLVANGIAYVSYNTYPGWYTHKTLREMMLYHTQQFLDPKKKIEQAKASLQLLGLLLKNREEPYSLLLKQQIEDLIDKREDYLFHEYLEKDNEPLFFHQFIGRAAQYDLHYLGDTQVGNMFAANFPADIAEILKLFEDQIRLEQFIDFLTNRGFRQTLLCHQAIPTVIVPQAITHFHLAGQIESLSPSPNLSEGIEAEFKHVPSGRKWSSGSSATKAMCLCLGKTWPQSLSFSELVEQVNNLMMPNHSGLEAESGRPGLEALAGKPAIHLQDTLINSLLALYMNKKVEFFLYPPPLTGTVSARPCITPLARLQAQRGEAMTNLHYENYSFDQGTAYLLSYLEGTHDRESLINLMVKNVEAGKLVMNENSRQKPLVQATSKFVDFTLQYLASKAFLVAQ